MGRDDEDDVEGGAGPGRGVGEAALLLPRLLAELPERRACLRRAREWAAADADGLEALAGEAHRLAGAAAYCGAEALRRAASALEVAARSGDGVRAIRLARTVDLIIGQLLRPSAGDE